MISPKTITLCIWALLLLPTTVWAADINPHLDDNFCLACHSKVPTRLEAQSGHSFLLGDTIDETCGLCHRVLVDQSRHTLTGHPTGIKTATAQSPPSTLPLSDGYITCKTCHRCIADGTGPTFAMLRTGQSGLSMDEERTALCRQCHQGY